MSVWRQRLLARCYDPIAAASLRERTILPRLLDLVATTRPQRILHLGCGRGWLTRELAARFPASHVVALDADEDVLAGARDRTRASNIEFVFGRAEAPPVSGPFDAIVSSLLLHHLPRDVKRATFSRAAELLAPRGQLVTIDFGAPQDIVMRGVFVGVQLAHGFDDTADNLDGSYLRAMSAAGLADTREHGRWRSWLGSVALYSAAT